MKMNFLLLAGVVLSLTAVGQTDKAQKQSLPITVTIFSESIGLPNFRNLLRGSNLGIRIGTELYHRSRESHQVFQTVNLGYYDHKNFQAGFFLNSEIGYRKFFGNTFADATLGVGYLLINSSLPRYELRGDSFVKSSSTFGRIMPTIGLGAGHEFKTMTVFSRYEVFGEMPFGFKGLPALPHKALHLGTRFRFN